MIQLLLKLTVSFGLVYWVISGLDTRSLFDLIARADAWWLLLGLVIQLLIVPLMTWRWMLLAARMDIEIRPLEAFKTVFIGQFFNQALPTSMGGDAVRIWRLTRLDVGLVKATASVFVDRLFGLSGLLLIPLMGYGLLQSLITDPNSRLAALATIVIGLGAAGLLVTVNFMPLPKRVAGWLPIATLRRLAATMAQAALHLKTGLAALAISLLIQGLATGGMWAFAHGLGASHAWLDYLVLVPFVMLVTMIPITIAGWGVREGAMVVAMSLLGGGMELAVATSLLFGVSAIAVSLVGGVMWLQSPTRDRVPVVADMRISGITQD